jgi:hypothetical protein
MLNFFSHTKFEKETAEFVRRFVDFSESFEAFKRICQVHFDPISPRQVIAPAKLHRLKILDSCIIWKVEVAVRNLRSNQSPRIWFAVKGENLAFLCLKTHIDNYDTNETDRMAEFRLNDIF